MDRLLNFACLKVLLDRKAVAKTVVATELNVEVGDMVRYRIVASDVEYTGEVLAVIPVTEDSEPHNWLRVATNCEKKTVVRVWRLSNAVRPPEPKEMTQGERCCY